MILLLLGCGDGTKDETDGPSCDRTETALTIDESTPLGFSAGELLTWLEGTDVVPFTLAGDSADRDVEIVVASDGVYTWVDQEEAPSTGGGMEPAIGVVCEDSVEVGATVGFTTSTGEFAESWAVTLAASASGAARATVDVELDEVEGSYAPEASAIEGCDETGLSFTLAFAEVAGPNGEVYLLCEATDGDTASMSQDLVGSWAGGTE